MAIYVVICIVGFYMGFSMEPSQKAYEEAIDKAAAPYCEQYEGDDFDVFMKKAKAALRSADPETELRACVTADSTEMKEFVDALLAAGQDNRALADEFNAAVRFSTVLFWCMAVLVGTVQGGIQAASRSYFGKLVPKERSNEFFGFFDIFGKFAAVIGPALYAGVASATGRSSYGVLGLIALFLCGLVILIAGGKQLDALAEKAE